MRLPPDAPGWAAHVVHDECPALFASLGFDPARHGVVCRMVPGLPSTLEVRSTRHPLQSDVGLQIRLDARMHDLRALSVQAADMAWLDAREDRLRASGIQPTDAPLWTLVSDAVTARLLDLHDHDPERVSRSGAILDRGVDSIHLQVIGLGSGIHLRCGAGARLDIDMRRTGLPDTVIQNLPGMPADRVVSHDLLDRTDATVVSACHFDDVLRVALSIPRVPARPAPAGSDPLLIPSTPWRRRSVALIAENAK